MNLNRTFHFSASHFLPNYNGKCENLHGHNYKLIITITDQVQDDGMVMDYKKIKEIVNEKIINKTDHTHLNDLLENPTTENIAAWIWDELKNELPLNKITVYETENCYCEYYGK